MSPAMLLCMLSNKSRLSWDDLASACLSFQVTADSRIGRTRHKVERTMASQSTVKPDEIAATLVPDIDRIIADILAAAPSATNQLVDSFLDLADGAFACWQASPINAEWANGCHWQGLLEYFKDQTGHSTD